MKSTNETRVSFIDGVRNTSALKHRERETQKERQMHRNTERYTETRMHRNTDIRGALEKKIELYS